jgi:hypothetical protein
METMDVPYGAMPGWLPDRKPDAHESPYPPELGPGVVARVVLKRSALGWLSDIEAYLAEQEMPISLAESVAKVMDVSGWSCAETVERFRELLDSE